MSELFLSVLNMSLTASYVILFVALVRLLLKKAPKFISYSLWGVVAFRLIIPFSLESMFSLLPRNSGAISIPRDIIYQQSSQVNGGVGIIDSSAGKTLPVSTIEAGVDLLEVCIKIGAYIWILGTVALLAYSIISVLVLKRQLKSAHLMEQNIYEAENLKTPFVIGLVRPRIYLPVGLGVDERSYILLHEQTHIHRKDHIIKILAFLVLTVHWFNPLVWIAFILMNMDMELSCDERVLKEMDDGIRKTYAKSLLSLSTERRILNGSQLAFGEGNVKGRINNVLNYKKPAFWAIVVSIIIMISVGVALMTDPKVKGSEKTDPINTGDETGGSETLPEELEQDSSIVYENNQYGFRFALPESWEGYGIVTEKWEDISSGGKTGDKVVETGPVINIRHPLWTSQNPRQDIPIMIFTLAQWESLQKGEIHVDSAPINPREIDRNNKFVFSLPARYNYAFPEGFEEVNNILEGSPLEPLEITGSETEETYTQTVQVYYACTKEAPGGLYPVDRKVSAGAGAIQATIEELLKGPTEEESARGYWSRFSKQTEGMLNSVCLSEDGKTVIIDFADFRDIFDRNSVPSPTSFLPGGIMADIT